MCVGRSVLLLVYAGVGGWVCWCVSVGVCVEVCVCVGMCVLMCVCWRVFELMCVLVCVCIINFHNVKCLNLELL